MLGNEQNSLWRMKNGYALDCFGGLARINKRLGEMSEANIDLLRQKLRVGLHSGVEVTHQNAQEINKSVRFFALLCLLVIRNPRARMEEVCTANLRCCLRGHYWCWRNKFCEDWSK